MQPQQQPDPARQRGLDAGAAHRRPTTPRARSGRAATTTVASRNRRFETRCESPSGPTTFFGARIRYSRRRPTAAASAARCSPRRERLVVDDVVGAASAPSSAATTARRGVVGVDRREVAVGVAGIRSRCPRRALRAIVSVCSLSGATNIAEAQHDTAAARHRRSASLPTPRPRTGSANAIVGDGVLAASTTRRRDRRRGTRSTPARTRVASGGERGVDQVARSLRANARVLVPRVRIGRTRERRDVRREVAHHVVTGDRGAQRVGVEDAHLHRRRAERSRQRGLRRRAHAAVTSWPAATSARTAR